MVYRHKKNARIINGPSVKRLLDAFAYAFEPGTKVFAEFKAEDGNGAACVYVTKITGFSHEDCSGEHFNIRGYYAVNGPHADPTNEFDGYYDVARRQGTLSLVYYTADDKLSANTPG